MEPPNFPTNEVLEHLEGICGSQYFSNSKRSQEFLRYIVQKTLQGDAGQLKERTIACDVFGRDSSFEPGEQSVVRVKASDVRKRLVEYYNSAPRNKMRIELPVGSYVPQFIAAKESPSAPPPQEHPEVLTDRAGQETGEASHRGVDRRGFLWAAGGALAAAGVTAAFPLLRSHFPSPERPSLLDLLWKPIFATKLPLIIFLPVMHDNGVQTEWTGIGPAAALGLASGFLARHHYAYQLRVGDELTYSQLRDSPSLLLGAFNPWITEITSRLNLRYTAHSSAKSGERSFGERSFVDSQTNQTWKTVKSSDGTYVTTDYGLVCRVFDANTGQVMFLVFGLYTFGTEAAAMVLFDSGLFSEVIEKAPSDWGTKMFQAIVRVSVVGTAISAPQLVASHFW